MDEGPPDSESFDVELIQSVKPDLEPGERLLWASRPGLRARKSAWRYDLGVVVWAVGTLLLSFGCFAASAMFGSNPRFQGAGILLATIGTLSGLSSFLIVLASIANLVSGGTDRSELAGRVYALTDRRAIVQIHNSRTRAVEVHSYRRGTIKGEWLHRVQYPDGSGDVLFQEAHKQPAGFQDVADVRRVEELIRRLLIVPGPDPAS